METRTQLIRAHGNSAVSIKAIPGHFATNHSHVNYYVDMTDIKTAHQMAREAAGELAKRFESVAVDTIICMEGTEMLGAFLAEDLAQEGTVGVNAGTCIRVVTPELNANNQMLFRDNMQGMIWEKRVLLLVASVSTGKTVNRLMECLRYYNGDPVGVAAIFSAISSYGEVPVRSIFTQGDVTGYQTSLSTECPLCRDKVKIDAIVNSYGYSKING